MCSIPDMQALVKTLIVVIFHVFQSLLLFWYKKGDAFFACFNVRAAAFREKGKEQDVAYLEFSEKAGKDGNLKQTDGNLTDLRLKDTLLTF